MKPELELGVVTKGGQKTILARNYGEMLKRQQAEYGRLNGTMSAGGKTYPLMKLRQVKPFADYWAEQIGRRFTDTSEWEYESPEDKKVHQATINRWQGTLAPIVVAAEAARAGEGSVRETLEDVNPGEMPELWRRTQLLATALDSNFPGPLVTKIPEAFTLSWWHDVDKKRSGGWGDAALALLLLWLLSE